MQRLKEIGFGHRLIVVVVIETRRARKRFATTRHDNDVPGRGWPFSLLDLATTGRGPRPRVATLLQHVLHQRALSPQQVRHHGASLDVERHSVTPQCRTQLP